TARVAANSTKKSAVGGVQAIHAMLSMAYSSTPSIAAEQSSLSHGERVGVRGYGLSIERNPSPGFLASRQIRPLPVGEVKRSPQMRFDRITIGLHPAEREAAREVIADKPDHQRAGNDGQDAGSGQKSPIHSGPGDGARQGGRKRLGGYRGQRSREQQLDPGEHEAEEGCDAEAARDQRHQDLDEEPRERI